MSRGNMKEAGVHGLPGDSRRSFYAAGTFRYRCAPEYIPLLLDSVKEADSDAALKQANTGAAHCVARTTVS